MKNKLLKFTSVILAICLFMCIAASCGKENEKEKTPSTVGIKKEVTKEVINIATLKGPSALGMLKMMDDAIEGKNHNTYKIESYSSADQIAPLIINKSVDIASIPTNLAATLYNKTNKNVSILAVTTLGVLSILSNGVEIKSVADLKGQTIYAAGKGATPEYALNYILEKNGLKVGKDVFVEYKSEHSEIVALMVAGKAKIGMLPQPFATNVTIKNEAIKEVINITEEWEKLDGNQLTMGCVIVRNDFLKEHKDAVNSFISELSLSSEQANTKIEETAELSGEFGIMDKDIVGRCLSLCNIVCITGDKMKQSVTAYLKTLETANAALIGGKMPEDDFYYAK